MKIFHIFLVFLTLKLVSMDKPQDRSESPHWFRRRGTPVPVKPAAASPHRLKRSSSDEEKEKKNDKKTRRSRRDSLDRLVLSVSPKGRADLHPLMLQTATPEKTITICDNPPLVEVLVPWECKYYGHNNCDRWFDNQDAEWEHIHRYHKIIAAKGENYNSWLRSELMASESGAEQEDEEVEEMDS